MVRGATITAEQPWILCIDEDVAFAKGLKWKLESRGFAVARAVEGEHGYRFAFETEPEVILLDLHLRKHSGEEVLSQLKLNPATAHIPLIVLTGPDQHGLDLRLLAAGACEVFQKPITYTVLADAVDRYAESCEWF